MDKKSMKYDVIVVGGGSAGMCASISAARQGVKTLLIESSGACGGMATKGLVGPFMTCYDKDGKKMIIKGIFEEIVNRMVERGFAIHPKNVRAGTAHTSWIVVGHDHVTPFEPEGLKLIMDEMLTEAAVEILYHTDFLSPILKDGKITGVVVNSKSGVEEISGKVVIDCTGDGDVAYNCGVPYEMGNEELDIIQPATMVFHICNTEPERLEEDIRKNINNFYRKDGVNYRSFHWRVAEAKKNGDWSLKRVSIGLFQMVKPDEWCVNTSRLMNVDATNNRSLTDAEIEGRKQVDEIMKFLKKYVPGCENAKLMSSGSYVGIRESRHILGEYRLTADDLLTCKIFDDSILLAANSVDVHGRFGPTSNEYIPISGDYYGVPYRSLIPKGVDGLLMAGRCISADSTAAGAIRVMPPCMAMGQAAGMAAALAVKNDCSVRNIDTEKLRAELKSVGAFL